MPVKNLSERERAILIVTVALAVSAAAYGLVIEPAGTAWNALKNDITSKENTIIKDKELLSRYDALEEEYKKFPTLIEKGESEERETQNALASIETISKESGCHIANVKPRQSKKVGSYREISFEVIAEGDIETISRFMYNLETSKALLRIKRFTITSRSEPSGALKSIFLINKILY